MIYVVVFLILIPFNYQQTLLATLSVIGHFAHLLWVINAYFSAYSFRCLSLISQEKQLAILCFSGLKYLAL